MIEERNLRKGRIYEAIDRVSKRGGRRKKKSSIEYLPKDDELHKDLIEVRAAQLRYAAAIVDDNSLLSIDNEDENNVSQNTVSDIENNENNENMEIGSV